MAQFVLVNVVVAVLMKHLEESHKQMEEDEIDAEVEQELAIEEFCRREEKRMAKERRKTLKTILMHKTPSLPSNLNALKQTVFP
ncbi:unnamed protein product, partial [Cyprideis torosa]